MANTNEMDHYEIVARKLIGMEIELSRRYKNFSPGYTTGKAKIKRYLLKQCFNITSNYGLACLRDALADLGYSLLELDYSSDLFIVNNNNFIINVRQINKEDIEDIGDAALGITGEFFKARFEIKKKAIEQNEDSHDMC